ncbi:RHS repeat-associated core domain-containing protein [Rummeliibacillus suwonensis]|nr:RHS repeat-associated core domain-containing protein [Rummeliibacillus suwonensis]
MAKDNPIRYAGYYYDEETKNYYLQARYYNPENGAFLALDPHPGDDDEPLSQNGYTYGNNNPIVYTDFDGQNAKRKAIIFIFKKAKSGAKFIWKKTKKAISNTVRLLGKPKKPLGRGFSKGGHQPRDLREALAMREAMSNPSKGKTIVGREKMKDKRWKGKNGWVKKAYNVNGIEVHYVYNKRTKAIDDFKIKD